MTKAPDFDTQAAHAYFSVQCFNSAWRLIDKPERTSEEDDEMLRLSQASLWHWTQRTDCSGRNLSVGYWQLSRICALLRQQQNAERYGRLALAHGEGEGPFYSGYAYEALARAEAVAGNRDKVEEYLAAARRLAEQVSDPEEQKVLLDDLDGITAR
jgi:hypothetical protein